MSINFLTSNQHQMMLFVIPYCQNENTPCGKIWSLKFIQMSSFIQRTLFFSQCERESISKCRSFANLPCHYGGFTPIKPPPRECCLSYPIVKMKMLKSGHSTSFNRLLSLEELYSIHSVRESISKCRSFVKAKRR